MYRKTCVDINVDNIENNIKEIVNKYDYKYYIGVVKGNAIGHGMKLCKYITKFGINYLAVSSLEEALEARTYTNVPILILEPIHIDELKIAEKNNIAITLSNYDYYKQIDQSKFTNLKIHLKLNTGMNRLGISRKEEIEEIYNDLIDNSKVKLEGIYTHFATTGVNDKYFDNQLNKFVELTSNIDLKRIEMVHLGRSCTLEFHPKIPFANGIRIGLIMYGIGQTFNKYVGLKGKLRKIKYQLKRKKQNISKTYEFNDINLKTGIELNTEVIELQHLKSGDKVGYGLTYTANTDTTIAICPIGYADGLSLSFKDSKVSINNKIYKIVGLVNMGMITVEVDDNVKVGDKVTLLGGNINIKEIARLTNNTAYTVMAHINSNIPRRYFVNGKEDADEK